MAINLLQAHLDPDILDQVRFVERILFCPVCDDDTVEIQLQTIEFRAKLKADGPYRDLRVCQMCAIAWAVRAVSSSTGEANQVEIWLTAYQYDVDGILTSVDIPLGAPIDDFGQFIGVAHELVISQIPNRATYMEGTLRTTEPLMGHQPWPECLGQHVPPQSSHSHRRRTST